MIEYELAILLAGRWMDALILTVSQLFVIMTHNISKKDLS